MKANEGKTFCDIKSRHVHVFYGSHADTSHLQGRPEGCRCEEWEFGPHRRNCPVYREAAKRIRELNEEADDRGIGYGVEL